MIREEAGLFGKYLFEALVRSTCWKYLFEALVRNTC